MKLKVEPSKFGTILNHALIGQTKPLLIQSTLTFRAESLHINEMAMNVVSVFGSFKKSFFSKYEATSEPIVVTKLMQKTLQSAFTDDKEITIKSEDTKIEVKGARETYTENLKRPDENSTPEKFPIKMKATTYGYLPIKESDSEIPVKIFMDIGQVKSLPEAEDYIFKFEGGKLFATIESVGKYTRELLSSKVVGENDMSVKVSSVFLKSFLGNLNANVWFMLHPSSLIVSETDDFHSLTYIVMARV